MRMRTMDCVRLRVDLQDLLSSIDDVASRPSNFVLHRSQCVGLARSYTAAVTYVNQQLDHTLSVCNDRSILRNLLPSLSELHQVILQGYKFMQDCSYQDGWVSKALILALTSEAKDVCFHDLVWCLCVVHQVMHQLPFGVTESQDEVFSLLNAIWADTSEKDDCATVINVLKHDMAHWEEELSLDVLPSKLQEELRSQYYLARFLLQKLLSETNFHSLDASCVLEYLWVDPLQFTIKEAIGRGSCGVVFEVEWYGQRYGQKEFFAVGDEDVFGKEAAIQARLRHPNVLQLICCSSKPSRNKCSLITELMDMDLRSAIDKRCKSDFDPPFPILVAVDLMLQIAKGMEYLHGLHIMHRDLKSTHLLVKIDAFTDKAQGDGRMRVKIAGFGFSNAKHVSSMYSTPQVGTSVWRAPEVLQSDLYTKKADVYSFAMVCYEVLTGNRPFDGKSLQKLHKRLLEGERPFLPASCPQYLASYIKRCWQSNPEERPSFAQISQTLREMKGILLTSGSPFYSLACSIGSCRSCTMIEDKLAQTMGAGWVFLASSRFTISKSSGCKVMESKLAKQGGRAAYIKQSLNGSKDHVSKRVGCFRWPFGRRVQQKQYAINIDSDETIELYNLRRFSYKELLQATDHFCSFIGRGGAGSVYKGTLKDGQAVAVKSLSNWNRTVYQEAFVRELKLLGRLRHRNLVPLFGFCCENNHLLLVHKFMPGGDLHSLQEQGVVLTWAQRYKILGGIASALDYLHNGDKARILHRDVKPSNILLDENREACLADFGIARLLPDSETHVTTTLTGTYGYIAPEYCTTLRLGAEADVYSFGIVALELASGRRCIERDAEIGHIVEYVWRMYEQDRPLDAAVENVRKVGDEEELLRVLLLGLACTQSNPKDRPTMSRVVQIVSKAVKAPIPIHLPYYLS